MSLEPVGIQIVLDSAGTLQEARAIANGYDLMGNAGDKAKLSTEKLSATKRKASSESKRLQNAYEKEVRDLLALQKANVTGKRESEAFIALRAEGTRAESRYGKQLLKTARQYDKLEASQKKVTRGMGSMLSSARGLMAAFGVGLGAHTVVRGLRSILEVTSDFKQEMANVASITGLSGDALDSLEKAARKMGATTKFTGTDAAKAFTTIGSKMPELLSTAEGLSTVTNEVLRFSQASNEDLTNSADLFAIAMNVYKIEWQEAATIGNLFAASIQKGAAFVPELIETLKDVAPIAKAAGVTLAELTAATQVLAGGQITGSRAATALKNTLIQLNTKGMKELETGTNSFGSVLAKVVEKELTFAEATEFFGRIAASSALTLTDQIDKYELLHSAIQGTTTVSQQMGVQTNTLRNDFLELNSAIQELQISIGEAMEGSTRDAVGFLANLTKIITLLPEVRKKQLEHGIYEGPLGGVRKLDDSLERLISKSKGLDRLNKRMQVLTKTIFYLSRTHPLGRLEQLAFGATKSSEALEKTNAALEELEKGIEHVPKNEPFFSSLAALYGPRATQALEAVKGGIQAVGDGMSNLSQEAQEFKNQLELDVQALSILNENLHLSKEELEAMAEVLATDAKLTEKQRENLVALTLERNRERKAYQDNTKAKGAGAKANGLEARQLAQLEASLKRERLERDLLSKGYIKGTEEFKIMLAVQLKGLDLSKERVQSILDEAEALDVQTAAQARFVDLATTAYNLLAATWSTPEELNSPTDALLEDFENGIAGFKNLGSATRDTIREFGLWVKKMKETTKFTAEMNAEIARTKAEITDLARLTQNRDLFSGFADGLAAAFTGADNVLDNFVSSFTNKFASAISQVLSGQAIPEDGFGLGTAFDKFSGWLDGSSNGAEALRGGLSGFAASYAISQQYGRGTQESQIGGVLSGALSGFAAGGGFATGPGGAIGLLAGALVGALQGGLFTGTKWRETGEKIGIEITNGAVSSARGYRLATREAALLGGTDTREVSFDLGSARVDQLAEDYDSVEREVIEQARSLGLSGAEGILAGFHDSFVIDLSGLETPEEIQAAYERAFFDIQNTLAANIVPYLGVFFDTGEEFATILERLSLEVGIVREGFALLGTDVDTLMPGGFLEQMELQLHDFFFQQGPGTPVIDGRENFDPLSDTGNRGRVQADQEGYEEFYDSAELLEAARIKFMEEVSEMIGGAEATAEAFGKIAATFHSTNDLVLGTIEEQLNSVSTSLDDMFSGIGSSRDSFLVDMDAALSGELDPETVALWIQAQAALADLMELERDLALARGEALQVGSLTVDQIEALDAKIEQLGQAAEALGVNIQLSQQAALDAQQAFGSLDEFLRSTTAFFDEFMSESEKIAVGTEHMLSVFEQFGLSMEQIADGGRELILRMAQDALDAGNMEEYHRILTLLGPAADGYLDALEEEERIKAALADETKKLNEQMQRMGFAINLSAEEAERLAESLGTTVDGLGERLTFVFDQFYSQEEQSAIRLQSAYAAITEAGYNLDYVLSLGRDGFVAMINAALAIGDEKQVSLLLGIADAVDVVFDSMEAIPDAVQELTQAFAQMAQQIASVRANIQNSINSVLSLGVPNAGPGGNLGARIGSLRGTLGSGDYQAQIDAIQELQQLIVTRYELERQNILHNQEIAQAQFFAVTQAEYERLERLHNEKVKLYEEELDYFRQMQSLSSSISGLLGRLETSELSGLSDFALLQLNQSKFFSEADAVFSGDSSGDNIGQLAEDAIRLARELFGSSEQGQAVFDAITARLREVLEFSGTLTEPNDPGELHLPTIADNSGATAYHTGQINDAQGRAIRELEELEEQLRAIEEALATEEEEARLEIEQREIDIHASILEQEDQGRKAQLAFTDILEASQDASDLLIGIGEGITDLIFETQQVGGAVGTIDIPAQLSESFATAMSGLGETIASVGNATIRALRTINDSIVGLDLSVNITQATGEESATGETSGEFVDTPPLIIAPP